MKPCSLRWAIVAALSVPAFAAAADRDCWVVAVAMNQHPSATEHWNLYGVEFAKVFQQHGKPLYDSVQAKTVLGKNARRDEIISAVQWAAANADAEDFVAVYFGCHGTTDDQQGWGIDTMDGQRVWGKELKEIAAKLPCPVLFVIDTCGSGGFAASHEQDVPLPKNCVAICSCGPEQSTSNVLNVALHEGLWGQADADNDEFVEVQEIVSYIQSRTSHTGPGGETPNRSEQPVLAVGEDIASDMQLTRVSGELSAIIHGGRWYLGRVDGEQGDNCKIHLMGQNDDSALDFFLFNEAPKQHVFAISDDSPRAVYVKNESTGELQPALLLGCDGDECQIRAVPGKGETVAVPRSQVRFAFPPREPGE